MQTQLRIGVDLGGTKTELIALGAQGEVLHQQRVPTPAHDYDAIVRCVVELVDAAERQLRARASIGIGTPGSLSPATQQLRNSNTLVLNGRPFQRDLEAALRRETRLANDANCFALSEAVDGAGRGARVLFGVILGTGTGGGVVIDRRVWSGRNGVAGEWGHNPLPWPSSDKLPGPACYCGKAGCIETFLSGPALARDYALAPGGADADAREVAERAGRGEPQALAALERYTDRLTRALAGVVNVLDPDAIVLGGGVSGIAALYPELGSRLGRYVFSDRVDTPVLPALHGAASGVRGAAWLWPQNPAS
ncbi:MAG TPA: ROK family protein [Polyangiales bacterium]|nr:ROK family protein [Polyangiales bacterium]